MLGVNQSRTKAKVANTLNRIQRQSKGLSSNRVFVALNLVEGVALCLLNERHVEYSQINFGSAVLNSICSPKHYGFFITILPRSTIH